MPAGLSLHIQEEEPEEVLVEEASCSIGPKYYKPCWVACCRTRSPPWKAPASSCWRGRRQEWTSSEHTALLSHNLETPTPTTPHSRKAKKKAMPKQVLGSESHSCDWPYLYWASCLGPGARSPPMVWQGLHAWCASFLLFFYICCMQEKFVAPKPKIKQGATRDVTPRDGGRTGLPPPRPHPRHHPCQLLHRARQGPGAALFF